MIRWIPYTFIRTTIFLCLGIVGGIYFPDAVELQNAWLVLAALVSMYFVCYAISKVRSAVNFGLLALPAVVVFGYIHSVSFNDSRAVSHFSHHQVIDYYQVTVDGYAEEKENSWKVVGKVTSLNNGPWQKATGYVLLYFRKADFEQPFNYGDALLIRGRPASVPPPSNPGEFDYRNFLKFRNIFHQQFLSKDNVRFVSQTRSNVLKYYAFKTRKWANEVLHKHVSGEREQAVASALILGVTDGLDNDLLQAYSSTGAMHVLAVSGLHISIIYVIILFFFKPLTKTKKGKAWVIAFSLFFLWGYAFVTGLSPSVLRAVTMFSFFAVAKIAARNTNVYNTLAASAFCLLIFDPYLVMSVGFQLSYLAVAGILYIHPLLQRAWEPETWIVNEIWKISSVSIAAQIGTLPVSLFYFHQFPNYFLLSNLLVIPISFVVLILGLAILAFAIIPVLAALTGWCLQFTIWLLNLSVIGVEKLPFSVIENINLTILQCWLLTALIIFALLVVQRKGYRWFMLAGTCCGLFALADWVELTAKRGVDTMTVYKVGRSGAIDFVSDGKAFFVGDTVLEDRKIKFHLSPNRLAHDAVVSVQPLPSKDIPGGQLIIWNGRKILYLRERLYALPIKESPDIVIIANDALNDSIVTGFTNSTTLIFDASNSESYLKQIMRLNIKAPFHSVRHNGSFTISMKSAA